MVLDPQELPRVAKWLLQFPYALTFLLLNRIVWKRGKETSWCGFSPADFVADFDSTS